METPYLRRVGPRAAGAAARHAARRGGVRAAEAPCRGRARRARRVGRARGVQGEAAVAGSGVRACALVLVRAWAADRAMARGARVYQRADGVGGGGVRDVGGGAGGGAVPAGVTCLPLA